MSKIYLRSKSFINYITELKGKKEGKSRAYLLKPCGVVQIKYDEHGNLAICPPGGPTITTGKLLKEVEDIVQEIQHIQGVGYVLLFDKEK